MTHSPNLIIRIRDLFGFLIGNRLSIHRVLHSRIALLYGAVLVLCASIARDYDSTSFYHHPFELLKPFGASLAIGSSIFVFVAIARLLANQKSPSRSAGTLPYALRFLTAYWWTAPLAWLYAVPVENWCSDPDAIRFNLLALSIVSIWRVLLFSRVLACLYRLPFWVSLAWVLVPCLVLVFFASVQLRLDLVGIMGGIRLTESETILLNFTDSVSQFIGWVAVPALLSAIVGILYLARKSGDEVRVVEFDEPARKMSVGLWVVPIGAGMVLGAGGMYFQPKLYRAEHVNQMLIKEDFPEAFEFMKMCGPRSFPVAWDPPPQYPRHIYIPNLESLLKAIIADPPDAWIVDRILAKADFILLSQGVHLHFTPESDEDYVRELLALRREHLEPEVKKYEMLEEAMSNGNNDYASVTRIKNRILDKLEAMKKEPDNTKSKSLQETVEQP